MRYLFTTKREGNMGLHVGDDPRIVLRNREQLAQLIGSQKVIFMNQVHGDDIIFVDESTQNPTCDAMISNTKGLALAVMVADCIPILFYDKVTQSVGVAHAGREGTRLKIASKTLQMMQMSFGAKAKDMEVYIGASIKVCCYEVGKEAIQGLEEVALFKEGKYYLDLLCANQEELLKAGIQREHLHIDECCTCCHEGYFSYRRERQTGRFVGVISL